MKSKIMTKSIILNLIKTVLIIILCTVVSYTLDKFGLRRENILMVYLTGVILVIMATKKYIWGVASSVTCVFTFNYFFTEPRMTLMINDLNYVISLIIFLILAFVASSLTSQLQIQAETAKKNEVKTKHLYQISKGYLNISGIDNIVNHCVQSLFLIQEHKCIIYRAKSLTELSEANYVQADFKDKSIIEDITAAKSCLTNVLPTGCGTEYFSTSKWKYIPIESQSNIIGVVGIYCNDKELSSENMIIIKTIISQMALAIERELLYEQQEENKIEMEKEKLRNNLLRAISHDLRTPLTGIAGSTNFIRESYDNLDKKTIISLLTDIGKDALWLNSLVENLLNMTRIQEGRLVIQKQNEVVDDIVSEALSRVRGYQGNRKLSVKIPDDVVLVPMDGKLIVQVIVNLLENAMKYTNDNAEVIVNVYVKNNRSVFDVSDNGGGVKEEMIGNIFDSFVSSQADKADSHRGIGLGLSICKSIVEAHSGSIKAFNNESGGATFRFTLPM